MTFFKFAVQGFGLSTRGVQCSKSGFVYDLVADACFIIRNNVLMNYENIKQVCAGMNSTLIKITSQEKQDWINGILATNTEEKVCIQGNSNNGGSKFKFDDGSGMTYFNWNNGQPDKGSDYYIYMKKSANYLWQDIGVTDDSCSIFCEK